MSVAQLTLLFFLLPVPVATFWSSDLNSSLVFNFLIFSAKALVELYQIFAIGIKMVFGFFYLLQSRLEFLPSSFVLILKDLKLFYNLT